MIEPFEKLDAVARGFKLSDLVVYEDLKGLALVKDLKTGIQKIYSYSYAKFLEDRDLVEVLAIGSTIEELTKNADRRISASEANMDRIIRALEKAESFLKAMKSGKSFEEVRGKIEAHLFDR
ncbi:MAG: hypothetical protein J7L83_04765 [Thaumarchaeota archaeon]|nr:hypothetical protein [Nitrososphaerota archaeon]